MTDINKLIATLEYCLEHGTIGGHECFRRYYKNGNITETNARANCPNKDCQTGCVVTPVREVIALLKAQDPREPHYTKLEYIVNGMPVTINHPECPRCHDNGLVLWDAEIEKGAAYCKRCGQALKWNGRADDAK